MAMDASQGSGEGFRAIEVLYELPFANLGGTEKHVLALISSLRGEVSARLLAPQGEALALFRRLRVPYRAIEPLAFSPRLPRSLSAQRGAFLDLIDGLEFPLVHVHAGIELAVAAKLARPDVPLVFTIHGYPDAASYVVSGFLASRIADEVICVSERERRTAERYGFPRDRLTVIHNGVDTPQPTGKTLEFRQAWGIPDAALVVGTVARLERRKGIGHLISAIPRVREERPDIVLLVVGSGGARRELEDLAANLGLADSVVFTGPLPDATAAFEAMDVFALPSLQDAFPLAVLEAMALARPVVATAVGGIPEAVARGETGLLVPPNDPSALSAAILDLAADPSKRRAFGERGRRRVEERFTVDLMAQRTLEVYRRVLASRRTTQPLETRGGRSADPLI